LTTLISPEDAKAGGENLAIMYSPSADPVASAYRAYPYPRGSVRLRLTLSNEGRVTKIQVLNRVHDGLLRQTVFAAIRMKFLPAEKAGISISSDIIYERSFANY
jgi:TonB family protein